MYEHLFKPTPTSKKPNNLAVRLAPTPVDEKVAYIESVCAVLIDSRFSRRPSTPLIVQLSDRPELEDSVFWETAGGYKVPVYTILSDSERVRREVNEIVLRELELAALSFAHARLHQRSPQTQGRGSPKISLGRTT